MGPLANIVGMNVTDDRSDPNLSKKVSTYNTSLADEIHIQTYLDSFNNIQMHKR